MCCIMGGRGEAAGLVREVAYAGWRCRELSFPASRETARGSRWQIHIGTCEVGSLGKALWPHEAEVGRGGQAPLCTLQPHWKPTLPSTRVARDS